MTKLIITCAALFCSFSIYAQSQDSYNGLWWNDDRSGIVELIVSEQGITGLTRWGENLRSIGITQIPRCKSAA